MKRRNEKRTEIAEIEGKAVKELELGSEPGYGIGILRQLLM